MDTQKKTPKDAGYIMPAEWHPHNAVWISWPHNKETLGNVLTRVESVYVEIVDALHNSERVNLLVNDKSSQDKIDRKLSSNNISLKNISFYIIKTGDLWIRDYGPNFILNESKSSLAMNNWIFNAWGNKYENILIDNSVPEKINKYLSLPIFNPGIVLEGGSIDVNGKGTCITTEQCLLNKNRNPALSRTQIEEYLNSYLGVSNIIWLKEGIIGDDTDGHIDDIARFVSHDTVVCSFEENTNDENYHNLKKNYEVLSRAKLENGNPLRIIKLPMPNPILYENKRLPASYSNFYIGNNAVLVPVFNQDKDNIAMNILKELFPNRKIVGINCTELVIGLGAIHCITQQEPYT